MSEKITIITIDNPPLNTLTKNIRTKLLFDLKNAMEDPVCKIILLLGSQYNFSVGADIKELSIISNGGEKEAMQSYVDAYNTDNVRHTSHMLNKKYMIITAIIFVFKCT